MSKSPIFATARRKPISTSDATSATGARSAWDSTAPTALTHVRLGDPDLVEQQYNNGEYFFKFSYDRLDNVHFPREGQTFTLQWDANRTNLGADIASDKVQADWLMARSNGRNTILLWTSAGSTLDGRYNANALPEFYSLGGFFNLSGLAPNSLFGPQYAIARAIYFRKIGRGGEGFFEFPAYIGMSLEAGNTWEHRGDISYGSAHKDASVFLAFDTFLGPVYLGSGYDQGGTRRSIYSWPNFLGAARQFNGRP